jgi:outer membrane protein assembly factor BamB
VPGPALDTAGERMLLTTFYDGSRLLRLKQDEAGVEELWLRKGVSEQRTDALHCMISPPYIHEGHVYGVDS